MKSFRKTCEHPTTIDKSTTGLKLEIDKELGPFNSEIHKWSIDLFAVRKALDAQKGQTNKLALSRVLNHLEETIREMSDRLPFINLTENKEDMVKLKCSLLLVVDKLLSDNFMDKSRQVAAEEVTDILKRVFFNN